MKLTVSYGDGEVGIAFDRAGLDHLAEVLTNLQQQDPPDHDHLHSEDWGGNQLTTDASVYPNIAHHLLLEFLEAEGGPDQIDTEAIPRDDK